MKTGQERETFRARAATLEQQVIELREAHEADVAYRQVRGWRLSSRSFTLNP